MNSNKLHVASNQLHLCKGNQPGRQIMWMDLPCFVQLLFTKKLSHIEQSALELIWLMNARGQIGIAASLTNKSIETNSAQFHQTFWGDN